MHRLAEAPSESRLYAFPVQWGTPARIDFVE